MSYTQTVPSTRTGSWVWARRTADPTAFTPESTTGIIHDLGNLIQIAIPAFSPPRGLQSLFWLANSPGKGNYYPRLLSENGRMNPMNRPS